MTVPEQTGSPVTKGADPLELDAETMRKLGYAVVDRVVERISTLGGNAAWRGAPRAQFDAHIAEPAPERGLEELDPLLDQLYQHVLPYAAQVDHPRFLAFVPGCPTWPGILGDWVVAAHNVFQGTWLGSSGPSALELVVLDWFKEWAGYPKSAAGLLLSGGSGANMTALASARAQLEPSEHARGVIYWCAEVHSSMTKAARFLGFAPDRVRVLPPDRAQRMPLDLLEQAVADDRARGLLPLIVVANAGTTSTGAIDPLPELAAFCARNRIWLHIDAAYGGFAVLTERGKALLRGLELADSITLDPHKWLYQPFEVGCLLVREGHRLERAFHAMPHYLQDTAVAGREVNFGDRGYQLTRSARAVKIWLSIQYFGLQNFRAVIDQTLDLTLYAEQQLREDGNFEILSPASLGIVCFRRLWPGLSEPQLEELNHALVRRLNDSGLGMMSSTRVGGRFALRFCVLNHRTTAADIDRVIAFLGADAPFLSSE